MESMVSLRRMAAAAILALALVGMAGQVQATIQHGKAVADGQTVSPDRVRTQP